MGSYDFWALIILISVGFVGLGQELSKIVGLLRDIHVALVNRPLR
jgi:hypothetical protein